METILVVDIFKKENSKFFIKDNLNIGYNIEFKKFEYSIGDVAGKGIEERAHDFILVELNQTKYKTCIINSDAPTNYFGEKFITHLRLTQNCINQYTPVLIISDQQIKTIISRKKIANRGIPSIFSCVNIDHLLKSEIGIVDDNYLTNLILKYSNEDIQKDFLSKINITPLAGAHSIANIWGAYRVSSLLEIDSPIKSSCSLYIKYLLAKYPSRKKQSESINLDALHKITNGKKVLYIDDESDLWENNLKYILGQKCQIDIIGVDKIKLNEDKKEDLLKLVKDKLKTKNYNVVILDLRLFRSDNDIQNRDDVKQFTSVKILNHIKKNYADISVLIFTASNKAWNHHYIKEAGAISSFIKESPDFGIDIEYSKQNLDNLVCSLVSCFERNDVLKNFWDNIKTVEKDGLISEDENREVIVDRLKTFFALINWQWFRSRYDASFSPYRLELAFITLWSVLNQIVQDYFCQKKNCIVLKSNDRIFIEKRGNEDFVDYIIYEYIDIEFKRKKIPIFKYNLQTRIKNKYARNSLRCYIEFILINQEKDQEKLKKNILELENINKFRNSIPWTHGVELSSKEQKPIANLHNFRTEPKHIYEKCIILYRLVIQILNTSLSNNEQNLTPKVKKVDSQNKLKNTIANQLTQKEIEKLLKGF